jgi:hypothetical protein
MLLAMVALPGVDINLAAGVRGETALITATRNSQSRTTTVLLESDANVNATCRSDGCTALHVAADLGSLEQAVLLAGQEGIDVNIQVRIPCARETIVATCVSGSGRRPGIT